MGIGTSLGAFHEDEFAHIASPWMEKPEDTPDNNVIDPTVDPESTQPIINLIVPIKGKGKEITFDSKNPNRILTDAEMQSMSGKDMKKYLDDSQYHGKMKLLLDSAKDDNDPDFKEYREDKPGPATRKEEFNPNNTEDKKGVILNPDKSLPNWVDKRDNTILDADKLFRWNLSENKKSMFYQNK